MATKDPRVDTYIAKARPFAQPILKKLRAMVHTGCPEVVETIKWGMPAFEHKGPLAGMAAFKEHCVAGFWKAKLLKGTEGTLQLKDRTAMGNLGCLRTVKDLPSTAAFVGLVRQAATLNDAGVKLTRQKRSKPPLRVPAWFMARLRSHPKALKHFKDFSPSHQREYVEWVTSAKQEDTRERRMATTIAQLSKGLPHNAKYMRGKKKAAAKA